MDTQIAWSKKSILDIQTDQPYNQSGQVSIQGSRLTLGENSWVSYIFTYGQSRELIRSNKLKLNIPLTSANTDILTRYKDNIRVDIEIQYYKEEENSEGDIVDYSDGHYDTITVTPYFTHERSGNTGYTDEFISDIDNLYIKSILVTFRNQSETSITYQVPRLYPSLDAVQAVKESGITGSAAEVESMGQYIDQLVVRYKDEELPAFIKKQELADNIYTFNVSDVYKFGFVRHNTYGPYGRLE